MRQLHELLAAHDGLLIRRELPADVRTSIDHGLRHGHLTTILPGVYAASGPCPSDLRLRAAMARFPCGVICGETAAALTFWPRPSMDVVHVAGVQRSADPPGFRFHRAPVRPEWIVRLDGLRVAHPALTAVELAVETDGESIDRALRTRQATLGAMKAALRAHSGRDGNRERHRLLLDSRDQPWSTAERLAHKLLRRHRFTGWCANHPTRIEGKNYFIDVCFPKAHICVEIDGRAFHETPEAFENDRWRQNALVLAGWLVLRFTWKMLSDAPDYCARSMHRALVRT